MGKIAVRAVAKWSFRTGCVLAIVWLLAVAVFMVAGYLDGIVWSMLIAPVAGAFMLVSLAVSAFSE